MVKWILKRGFAIGAVASVAAVAGTASSPTPAAADCHEDMCGTTDVFQYSYCDDPGTGWGRVWKVYDRYVIGCDPHPVYGGEMCKMTYPNSGVYVCDHGPECYQYTWEWGPLYHC
jgi:hypothetical protein